MTFIADHYKLGYLPFRDHTPSIELGDRRVLFGIQLKDIDTVRVKPVVEKLGDVQFGHFLDFDKNKRKFGSWSWCTPSIIEKQEVRPVFDMNFGIDDRYTSTKVGTFDQKKYAFGVPGIRLAGSDEHNQEDLFLPCFSELVSNHRGKSANDFSTFVYDVNQNDQLDSMQKAGIHSSMIVEDLPRQSKIPFLAKRAISWNQIRSNDLSGLGLFSGYGDGTPKPNLANIGGQRVVTVVRNAKPISKKTLGLASSYANGFMHPGHEKEDKHIIGQNEEGVFMNAGHIDYNAYFYANALADGPLDLNANEFFPQRTQEGTEIYRVHCSFDPFEPHRFLSGTRKGKWKWYVKIPFFILDPPDTPTTDTPPDWPPDWPPPFPVPVPPQNPPWKHTPPGMGGGGGITNPSETIVNGNRIGNGLIKGAKGIPTDPLGHELEQIYKDWLKKATGWSVLKGAQEAASAKKVMGTHLKMSVPGLIFKPYLAKNNNDRYNPNLSKEKLDRYKKEAPSVLQMEAFSDEWARDKYHKNRQVDRYQGGTADGGLVFFPPELGMIDRDAKYTRTGQISNVTIALFPEYVSLAWAKPNTNTGRGKDGIRSYLNSTQDLVFEGLGFEGAPDQSKNIKLETFLKMKETSLTPSSEANYGSFFVKTADSLPYFRTDTGVEYALANVTTSSTVLPSTTEGRLTLTSGSPIVTTDQASKSTIYFTPYLGNQIALYNTTSTNWEYLTFTEASIALPATAGVNYDIFAYDVAGTLTLELVVWTNITTRATALAKQDSVYVKSGTADHKYLGSVYTPNLGLTDHTATNRYLWNYYHRKKAHMSVGDGNSHYYLGGTRLWNGSTTPLNFIVGVVEETFAANTMAWLKRTGAAVQRVMAGFGLNTTAGMSADVSTSSTYDIQTGTAAFINPREGFNSINPLEDATLTQGYFWSIQTWAQINM